MKKYICFFLLAYAVLVVSAQAADSPAYELGEIIVSEKGMAAESVGTVHRITAADIEVSGARTLNEVIKRIPGLYVRLASAGTPRMDIRGLKTRHIRFLLNGVPIQDTYDGQFDPTTIPVDHISEIKITTGGGSVLYGPGGGAGIINIITKKGSKDLRGAVTGELGSNDTFSGNALVSGAGEKIDGFISADITTRDAFELSDDFKATGAEDGDDRENSDSSRVNFFTGLGYNLTDTLDLGLTLGYVNGDNGIPPSTITDKKDIFASKAKYERVKDLEGYNFQAAFDKKFLNNFELRGWAYANQLDTLTKRYDNDDYDTISKKNSYSQDSTSRIMGMNLQLGYTINDTSLVTLALMAEENSWSSDGYEINSKEKKDFFDVDTDLEFYSLALEYNLRFLERLDLVLGLGQHFMEKEKGSSEDDFSFMIGAGYDLTDTTRLKGSVSKNVRFPSTKQLFDVQAGNQDLEAERIYTYEVGVEQFLPYETLLIVTGYIKDAKDFIEEDKGDINQNFEEYNFEGVEIGIENQFIPALWLKGSYAWMDSKDNSHGSEKHELQYRPGQQLTLEGRYSFSFGLTAYLSFMHVADQYYYSKNSPLEKAKLDDFEVLDAKISQLVFDDKVEIYLRGENLLDELYCQSYGIPSPGRTIFLGAKFKF